MKKLTPKQKKYLLSRSKCELRKRRPHSKRRAKHRTEKTLYYDLETPIKFTLQHEDCEEVIKYINKIKKLSYNYKDINIKMDLITHIDESAIAMLLSVMEELGRTGVRFKGTKPKDSVCKNFLERSGFFKYVNGKVDKSNQETKNTILNTGDKTASTSKITTEISKSMETIWGQKGRSPSVYSCAFEMMRNSCDHAFKKNYQIRWHFALSHSEDSNSVSFSFVDNGKGIIKTLKRGKLKRFISKFTGNVDIAVSAFKNGIDSRTGHNWRGKGLPTIYEFYEDNNIKNLVIISNDVYIDFDRNIEYRLNNEFAGTYYFWKVDQTCVKECFEYKNKEV